MASMNDVISEALQLSEAEQLAVVEALYDRLAGVTDHDAAVSWEAEIQRRLDLIDSGEGTLVPWKNARARIMDDGA